MHLLRLENISLDAPDSEDAIISSLSEDQYQQLCPQLSISRRCYFQISTECPVGPGIFQSDSQPGTCVRITEPLQILAEELHWDNHTGGMPGELLPNLWIRYDFSRMSSLQLALRVLFPLHELGKSWVAQASRIFAELEEVAHIEDYVCVDYVRFSLRITDKRDIPDGYLFVCPSRHLRTNTEPHANLYQWPACPAYWSFDPSGADRLSMEDANNLGFPAIHIETRMFGYFWDRGLRRFHEGKEHDPESREVARQLGYPLFESRPPCEAISEPLLLHDTPRSRGEKTIDVVDEDEIALDSGTPLIRDVAGDLGRAGLVELLDKAIWALRPHPALAPCQKGPFHRQRGRKKERSRRNESQEQNENAPASTPPLWIQRQHTIPALFALLLLGGIATEIIVAVAGLYEFEGGGIKTASSASAVSIDGSWLVVGPEKRGRRGDHHRDVAVARGVLNLILAGGVAVVGLGLGEVAVREAEEAKDELARLLSEDAGYEFWAYISRALRPFGTERAAITSGIVEILTDMWGIAIECIPIFIKDIIFSSQRSARPSQRRGLVIAARAKATR
ncbi:hypothetical protein MSAN_01517000 [Mycena sanguinolenta]|uniref:Uncharacterized protein n=1 Tax=Mycena sanguinolenta TaxID=230812 RepID=A0A8H7CWV3_9AGAR|nr:hypothetical protein MSAN_01517000 [Mycena sanguinolenta]